MIYIGEKKNKKHKSKYFKYYNSSETIQWIHEEKF